MAISRCYLHEHRFMLCRARGDIDDASLYAGVLEIEKDVRGSPLAYRELADCRDVTNLDRLSVRGTIDSARRSTFKRGWRVALLIPPDNRMMFGMARAFQMFVEDRVANVGIFVDPDAALDWLVEDEAERGVIAEFIAEQARVLEARSG